MRLLTSASCALEQSIIHSSVSISYTLNPFPIAAAKYFYESKG